ncbi:GH16 domain-containing protein [Pseudozyma hubeiensis]|nr:GH16 domain-containing protein [Pseudozyma hubeiensis]
MLFRKNKKGKSQDVPGLPPSSSQDNMSTETKSIDDGQSAEVRPVAIDSLPITKSMHRDLLQPPRGFASRSIDADTWVPPNLWSLSKRGKRSKRMDYLTVLIGITVGVLASGAVIGLGIYHYMRGQHNYCLALDEQFDGPLNTNIWTREVQVGGFGNKEFQWTTASSNNSYTKDGMLYITPTLTSDIIGDAAVTNGYTVNLTRSGECTAEHVPWMDRSNSNDLREASIGNADTNCQITSNSTLGTVIPPVQSARLTTNSSFSMRYGRVEVRARMPTGDWLWPAVWMMPKDSVYGQWPKSGEIDIFEGKGNQAHSRRDLLSNTMRSALHWGNDLATDQFGRTSAVSILWRKLWNDDFHTFGLEWDEHGIWTWRDSRARRVLNIRFDQPFINRMPLVQLPSGAMAPATNPWSKSPNNSAPFDQEFYLIVNLAVGGTNGYFADVGQPWSNDDPLATGTFWSQKDSWLRSWGSVEKRSMVIDYVKAWKRC